MCLGFITLDSLLLDTRGCVVGRHYDLENKMDLCPYCSQYSCVVCCDVNIEQQQTSLFAHPHYQQEQQQAIREALPM